MIASEDIVQRIVFPYTETIPLDDISSNGDSDGTNPLMGSPSFQSIVCLVSLGFVAFYLKFRVD